VLAFLNNTAMMCKVLWNKGRCRYHPC